MTGMQAYICANVFRCAYAPPPRAQAFNTGDYVAAILSKQRAETLSSVLYPDDRTYEGKELRLKQQHFFVSATIQVSVPNLSYGIRERRPRDGLQRSSAGGSAHPDISGVTGGPYGKCRLLTPPSLCSFHSLRVSACLGAPSRVSGE